MTNFDDIIIGFGKGGKTLSATLAKAGRKVALIEKSAQMYGGTCINIGCIPSKKLSYLAKDGTPQSEAVAQKNTLIGALNRANYDKFAQVATIFTGTASFVDATSVRVVGADGEKVLTAKNIYINTGARPFVPPIDGINHKSVYDSTSIMNLGDTPKHLAIIGGGYIGLEFAFSMANFGAKVSIIEAGEFLPKEDDDIKVELIKIMHTKGIEVINAQVVRIDDDHGKPVVVLDDGQINADAVLVATGRRANTDELMLDNAGVSLNERGFIKVNDKLQTSMPHIYAMGDVAGSPQFTYISLDDFRVVQSQVLGDGSYTTKGRTFPYAVFCDPPLAVAGLTQKQAAAQGIDTKTAVLPAAQIPNAKVLGKTDGLLKAVIDNDGKIIGAQLLCADAHELINFVELAIKQNLHADDIARHIFTHPTMAESLNDLFGAF